MKIFFSAPAKKDYSNLRKSDQKKVKHKIKILKQNYSAGKKLRGELKGLYSLKAWPYRIVYKKAKTGLIIVTICHRQGVYK